MTDKDVNGWIKKEELVLATLKRHEGWLKEISKNTQQMSRDVHLLKYKAGFWGTVAGTLASGVVVVVAKVFRF